MRRWFQVVAVVTAVALSTEGCGISTGNVQGRVLVFGPVPHPGVTTTLPISRFLSTVEAGDGKQIVARDRVLPGAQIHFVLAPGVYVLSVAGVPFCRTQVRIVAERTTKVNVRCVEP
jgi:hypothetical protein